MKKRFPLFIGLLLFSSPLLALDVRPGRRDPFWPLVTSTGEIKDVPRLFQIEELKLQEIKYSTDGKATAVINGMTFWQKDRWGPYQLKEIQENAVLLEGPQGTVVLPLSTTPSTP